MKVTPLHQTFAAQITQVDLASVSAGETFDALRAAFDTHGVLVFPDQQLTDRQQLAFAKLFGELETFPEASMQKDSEKIYNVSNIANNGAVLDRDDTQILMLKGTQLWHTDSSYRHVPALASFLYALEIPDDADAGGETEFADMLAACDALPEDLRQRISGRHMVHNYEYERIYVEPRLPPIPTAEKALVPPVTHPVLRYHPERQRHSVYITANVGGEIGGLPAEQAGALHKELLDFVTQPRFVYRHRWQTGDLLVWDNRRLLHRVLPYDVGRVRRVMRRTSVTDTQPPIADWIHRHL